MEKEPRFGGALPDELREPQRIKTTDPAPHLPFCNLAEPGYPTMSTKEKVIYGIIIALVVVAVATVRYWR